MPVARIAFINSCQAAHLVNLGFRDGCRSLEEIEIAAFIGLSNMLQEQLSVSARINSFPRTPGRATVGKLLFADLHVQLSLADVEFNHVTFLQQSEWAADKRFRAHVQDTSAAARAAHPRSGHTY